MLYEVPGVHLDRGAEAHRRRSEGCLGGRLGAETGLTIQDIRDQHPEEGPVVSTGNASGVELFCFSEDGVVEKSDLIGSTRNLAALATLYISLVSGRRISPYAAV